MPVATISSITGLILAGGQGARIGGADKGLVELHGLPLVEHVLGRLAPQVSSVMISATRNLDRYRQLVPRVVSDAVPSGERHAGPLAGIHSGLTHAPTAWVAVVPCDVPQLPRTLVARLADAVNDRGVAATFVRVDGRQQSVFCLLATSLAAHLHRHIELGGRAVHGWLGEIGATAVDFDDSLAFRNVNTVDELSGGVR